MYVSKIKNTILFRGMSEKEISDALEGLRAVTKKYKKGATILHAGSVTKRMGLVLEGSVTIENNDVWGNRTIFSHVGKNQFFAETYGLLANEPMLVDVVANEDCHILFLSIGSLDRGFSDQESRNRGFPGQESWIAKIMSNLLIISTQKNLTLSGRIFHTAPKTIRGRVMSYLNSVSIQKGMTEFDIPFDRQQMADYLNLDRTALSKELRKMKDDGLIDFHKNHFHLKETTELSI